MQTFSILLWREAEQSPIDFPYFTEHTFNTINMYNELPSQYRPNYLTACSKSSAEKMCWELSAFQRELLKPKHRVEKKGEYSALGYIISFFSSLEDISSFGYSLSIGNTNSRFFNSIVIDIAPSFNLFELQNAKIIKDMWVRSVKEFQPIWGLSLIHI